jgi:hypothetical protein
MSEMNECTKDNKSCRNAGEDVTIQYLLGAKLTILELTVSSFIKYQLKRKPSGADASPTFIKTITKLYNDSNIEKTSCVMDGIIAYSTRYASNDIYTNEIYEQYPEEAKSIVLQDLIKSFNDVSEKYIVS